MGMKRLLDPAIHGVSSANDWPALRGAAGAEGIARGREFLQSIGAGYCGARAALERRCDSTASVGQQSILRPLVFW